MDTRLVIAIAAITASACASHTGIVAVGNDQFMIAKQQGTGFSGLGNLKAEIIAEASQYCAASGKQLDIVSAQESQPPYIFGNYPRAEIQFRCIAAK